MLIMRYFSGIATPVIAGYHADSERSQQCESFPAGLIGSGAESVGQNVAIFGVICVPQSVLLSLAADETSLLIEFVYERHISMSDRR
ncbi:Uncharacterised protein [Yersinia pseudotuberculosis]|uniref:Uncharacterized protein n=1 Tax=Yersinia pseudotuberculosis TaxID=633 RepID=A0A380QC24_YERPU|nr:Uncharacterised protein [Yersinia pseudotuberculosis]